MLKLHILNVGHGDCIIVDFPSQYLSVVDINRSTELDDKSVDELFEEYFGSNKTYIKAMANVKKIPYSYLLSEKGYKIKLCDPINYIKKIANGRIIFRFISTHSHMDHLSGLRASYDQIGIINFWVINNEYEPDLDYLSDTEKEDWALYTEFRKNSIDEVRVIRPMEGDQRDFWQQDGIHILAPNSQLISDSTDPNEISYVLLIKYGNHKIILGGDAEEDTWDYIVSNYPKTLKNVTVLKASHHGRDNGYHQEAVKLMSPDFTIISVGKKPENDASQKYRRYSNKVLSTRWNGTIVFSLEEDGTGHYQTEY